MMSDISNCSPYGDLKNAKIMIIGHDPRLQISGAEARFPFFLEYLKNDSSTNSSDKRKKDFAVATVDYIKSISGSSIVLEDMYFTNLCNRFLERPNERGTVLISNDIADRGVTEIENDIKSGSFQIILPMSVQVFYHLVRTGFVDDPSKKLKDFLERAKPHPKDMQRNAYRSYGKAPFLTVCGQIFRHRLDGIPIVPILHVKQQKNPIIKKRYGLLMEEAAKNVRKILKTTKETLLLIDCLLRQI